MNRILQVATIVIGLFAFWLGNRVLSTFDMSRVLGYFLRLVWLGIVVTAVQVIETVLLAKKEDRKQ